MKKFQLKQNIVTIVFILFFAALCLLFIFLPKEDFSEKEKRYLAEFPEFSASSVLDGSFTGSIETYLGDHTPLRDFFVGVNSYYNYALGNNGANGIYLCDDGYLIEKPVQLDKPLDESRLKTNTEKIASFSETLDIPTYFALAPSKGAVYSEKLPAIHLDYNDSQYFSFIKEKCEGKTQFIDLYSLLCEKKGEGELFYKTDHHWTSLGAFTAYNEICSKMGIEAVSDKAQYDVKNIQNFFGTSFAKSGYWLNKGDTIEVWQPKNSKDVSVEIIDGSSVTQYDTMFIDSEFATADKYNGFLGGNHSIVRIKNPNAQGKLIVLKDSFAHSLVPFLSQNYGEIVMVDLRYYKKPIRSFIEEEHADALLYMYSIDGFALSTDIVLY